MKYVIDTSSLLALVRYYLPFDKDDKIKNLLESKILSKEIIILDKVVEESKWVSKGIIIEELYFIKRESIKQKLKTYYQVESISIYLKTLYATKHRRTS